MAYKFTNQRVILVNRRKDVDPIPADAVTLCTPFVPEISTEAVECKRLGTGFGNTETVVVRELTTATGTIEGVLRDAEPGVPPEYSDLYQICGLRKVMWDHNGEQLVTYRPMTDGYTGGNIWVYDGSHLRKLIGAVGNLKMTFEVGQPIKMSVDIQSFTDIKPESATPPTIVQDDGHILIVESVSVMTIDDQEYYFTKAEFDLGNDIQQLYHTGPDGRTYSIADFQPKVVMTEYEKFNEGQPWQDLDLQTIRKMKIEVKSGRGLYFSLIADHVRHDGVKESDDDGRLVMERTLSLLPYPEGSGHFQFVYSGTQPVATLVEEEEEEEEA